jgi:Tol biopolymer transport system component
MTAGSLRASGRVRVLDGLMYVSRPAWSPDGTEVVFTRAVARILQLYIVGVDGRNLRRLT